MLERPHPLPRPPPARPRTKPARSSTGAKPTRRERSATASAARHRAYRARRKAGQLVVPVIVDGWILDLLTEAGFLAAWDASDRAAVARALQDALTVWSRYEATP